MTWLYARLEYNFCNGQETRLAIYQHKKDADSDEGPIHVIKLDNADLTEMVVHRKIKPMNTNA